MAEGEKYIEFLCACNKKPCEGACRKEHLYRKRKDLKICPGAYEQKLRK